ARRRSSPPQRSPTRGEGEEFPVSESYLPVTRSTDDGRWEPHTEKRIRPGRAAVPASSCDFPGVRLATDTMSEYSRGERPFQPGQAEVRPVGAKRPKITRGGVCRVEQHCRSAGLSFAAARLRPCLSRWPVLLPSLMTSGALMAPPNWPTC